MKKLFTYSLATLLCFCACNKEKAPEVPAEKGWVISIQATMGADAKALSEDPDTHKLIATFETTDNIYIYNKTKNVFLYSTNILHPDRDGASANLTGTLAGDYDEGDELVLCYTRDEYGGYNYINQRINDLSGVSDCAEATVTITAAEASSKTLSTSSASFHNLQSVFQLQFTDGTSPVPVKGIRCETENGGMISSFFADGYATTGYADGMLPDGVSPTTDPVYLAFRNESTADDIYHFRVYDGSDVWLGDKAAPAGKIGIGKYYTLSAPIPVTKVLKPTVTVSPDNTILEPSDAMSLTYYLSLSPTTISGTGERYHFVYDNTTNYPLMITLSDTHLCEMEGNAFENTMSDFAFTLQGNSEITVSHDAEAIKTTPGKNWFSSSVMGIYNKGNVVFSGDGTLTVTASSDNPDDSGNYAYSKGILHGASGAVKAAYGYMLSVTDGVDNGDGTTTWVYTVAPDPGLSEATLTIHDGTVENQCVPFWGLNADYCLKCEFIIPDAEIEEMSGAVVKSMKFYLKEPENQDFTGNCKVYLKVVTNNPFASSNSSTAKSFIGTTNATKVYDGTLSIVGGELTIPFDNPFTYNVGNLLVCVYKTEAGNYKRTTFYGETVNKSSLSASGSSFSSISIGTQQNYLPKTTFTYGPATQP